MPGRTRRLKLLLKLIDDVIIEGDTLEDLLSKIETVFQRCREHGIILSEKKIQVGLMTKRITAWKISSRKNSV